MSLEFRHISHSYGDVQALSDIELKVTTGEVTCLLGASGCGKTTLLQLAAGLQPVQAGEIRINNMLLAGPAQNPAPEDRPVGMVFQDGALFPHMTVAQNIAFGLQGKAGQEDVAAQWLEHIGLTGMGGRYPHMLSGGQQQRVALARAMLPEPAILLMDEPFANIDVVLRRKLRDETRLLLKKRGATVILVTHDPQEAMEIGDKIAVMDAGKIVQFGSADGLYDAPETLSVGMLFGEARLVAGEKQSSVIATDFGQWPLSSLANDCPKGKQLRLLVRPDALTIVEDDKGQAIVDIRRVGSIRKYVIESETGARLSIDVPLSQSYQIGERVSLSPKECSIFAYSG